jgi:hypothetical protein
MNHVSCKERLSKTSVLGLPWKTCKKWRVVGEPHKGVYFAMTKSEARSFVKKSYGLKRIPVGTKFYEMYPGQTIPKVI